MNSKSGSIEPTRVYSKTFLKSVPLAKQEFFKHLIV